MHVFGWQAGSIVLSHRSWLLNSLGLVSSKLDCSYPLSSLNSCSGLSGISTAVISAFQEEL